MTVTSVAVVTVHVDGEDVHIEGTTKGDPTERAALKGTAFRWSRGRGVWVLPRNLRPLTRAANVDRFVSAMRAAGRVVEVDDSGARETAAERRANEADRLAARADRLTGQADARERESEAAGATWSRIADRIPLGQPILVGHHSERRHRRDLDRIDAAQRREVEAAREAEEAQQRADNIRARLERGDTARSIQERLARKEPELRRMQRSLARADRDNERVAAWVKRVEDEAALLADEIDLDRATLAELERAGSKVWGPADFKRDDLAAYWGGWAPVVRVNKTTLTVRSPHYGWEERIPYRKITGRRPAVAEA